MAVQTRIQIRRGTSAQWVASAQTLGNGILYQGEIGYETDTGRFKIGDGSTAWSSLSYSNVLPSNFIAGSGVTLTQGTNGSTLTIGLSNPTIQVANITDFAEGVDDRVSALLNAPAGSGISLNYVDASNRLDVAVDSTVVRTSQDQTITGRKTFFNRINISGVGTSSPPSGAALHFIGDGGSSIVFNTSTSAIFLSQDGTSYISKNPEDLLYKMVIQDANGIFIRGTASSTTNVSVSGDLSISGSGLVSSNINDFNTAVRTNRLDQMGAPTASVSLNNQKITNLGTPTADSDAATKAYVDAARSGLDVKQSVRVATTTNLLTLFGLLTIDGVTLVAGDRVLVKDQTGAQQPFNGIYVVSAGSWSRATDADSSAEVTAGMFTFVTEGTANADSGWVLTTNDTITLDTTALTFAQFSGAGQITAGAGMVKSGNTLDVGTASSSRIVVNADNIDLATVSQSNSSGTAGINFAQTISVDSYGRVTGVTSADVRDATTSVKGIASFDTGDFSVTSGAVSIKASGVGNSQLENSSITVGSTNISLGSTSTTLAGLTSVTSTSFVGSLTGNASTATTLQNARTINGTSFDGSANITIAFVDGGTP